MNQRNGVRRSFLYPSEHENNPGFPFLAVIRVPVPDSLYKPVIFGLVMGDISAQVKYRQIDKAGNHEIEYVNDTPCTSISVIEGVDTFKLVVNDSHLDQWIEIAHAFVVDKLLKIFGSIIFSVWPGTQTSAFSDLKIA